MTRGRRHICIITLVIAGLLSIGESSRIHLKAILAQFLLQKAWSDTQDGATKVKPWPWADTWPLARLTAPSYNVDMIVLAGATGRTLAFGPGHVLASAAPGSTGNSVIVGHRDSHFGFLKLLSIGDVLNVETVKGEKHTYRVTAAKIVHQSDMAVMASTSESTLTLITCYPFDAVMPGGPLRYVVSGTSQRSIVRRSNPHQRIQPRILSSNKQRLNHTS